MDLLKDSLRAKNSYSDKELRISFSVQAVNCDQDKDSSCESEENINAFFKSLYFTAYTLVESIEFGDVDSIGERPVKAQDKFHSQFVLDRAVYRDNNNFIQFNDVYTHDSLYSMKQDQYAFLDLIASQFWQSSTYNKEETVSIDGGLTTIDTSDDLIFGMYFFVNDYRNEHWRLVYNAL